MRDQFAPNAPSTINFVVGDDGLISISLIDGHVELQNCNVDEAAAAFWNAVQKMAPMKRDAP